jgi:hypothetical protein
MNWAKSKYNENIIDNRISVTTLEFLCESKYHTVYQVTGENPNQYVVVWKDQQDLTNYVRNNIGSVFGLKFLKKSNSKHSYTVNTPHGLVVAITLAEASALVDGAENFPRSLYVTSNGNVIIE